VNKFLKDRRICADYEVKVPQPLSPSSLVKMASSLETITEEEEEDQQRTSSKNRNDKISESTDDKKKRKKNRMMDICNIQDDERTKESIY